MDAQNVKGTRDILLEEGDTFTHIENLLMMILLYMAITKFVLQS